VSQEFSFSQTFLAETKESTHKKKNKAQNTKLSIRNKNHTAKAKPKQEHETKPNQQSLE
jgi:hypothetical protein